MSLRVGVCGLGSAAHRAHLPALAGIADAADVEVAAVCDPDRERRTAVATALGGARRYPDATAMLHAGGLDLLVIASPPSCHLEALTAAAEHGVDVLCEKPLGLTAGDVSALEQVARQHPGRLLATVHQYRHAPAWTVLARAVRASLRSGVPFRVEAEVERPGTDPLSSGGWRAHADREGGILGDHGSHYLALCHDLTPLARVIACRRHGAAGREGASVRLRLGLGEARIELTYAGERRRNRVAADIDDGRLQLEWLDDALTVVRRGRTTQGAVGALSRRDFVNRLYQPMYRDLVTRLGDDAWRADRTAETMATARLLSSAFSLAARPATQIDGGAGRAAAVR
ncbi:MAG: Gfo/Idh/MocA family oxidoreductase [Chloroflexi bacterium]|nr:MAG: Gfo/Idh/MocA family oxidoreductase [Chloroflexota bacterium]